MASGFLFFPLRSHAILSYLQSLLKKAYLNAASTSNIVDMTSLLL